MYVCWQTPAAAAVAGRGEVPPTKALAGGSEKAEGEVKEVRCVYVLWNMRRRCCVCVCVTEEEREVQCM